MNLCKASILILFGLRSVVCSHFSFYEYLYISSAKTWKDAQLYCREKHIDLATFESIEKVNELNRPATISGKAWIGLQDDPKSWKGTLGNDSNSWRWSTTGQEIETEYHNWKDGQPSNKNGNRFCGLKVFGIQWRDAACKGKKEFFCYKDMGQNQKTYFYIAVNKSWHDAQAYCRQNYTDLALITNAQEDALVVISVVNETGWIGLSRTPWTWSDMSPLIFTNWLEEQPDNENGDEHCAAEDENHQWSDLPCTDLNHFVCYGVRRLRPTVKMTMKTRADLTDPAVRQQIVQKMEAVFTSQGWTHFKLWWTIRPHKAKMELT